MLNKDYASVLALNNYGTATPKGSHSTGNRGVLTSRMLQQAPGGEHCCEFNFPHSLQAQAACEPLQRWFSHELAAWMASLGGAYREAILMIVCCSTLAVGMHRSCAVCTLLPPLHATRV